MNVSPQLWNLICMLVVAYIVYLLNKHDRNQNELFKRITEIEIGCAANHGKKKTI